MNIHNCNVTKPLLIVSNVFMTFIDLFENKRRYYEEWRCEENTFRSSHPEVYLRKGFLKTCSKFIGEHPWRGAISIKLQSTFIEIKLRHWCSPVNLLHIFRKPFLKNTSGWLLLYSERIVLILFKLILCNYFNS